MNLQPGAENWVGISPTEAATSLWINISGVGEFIPDIDVVKRNFLGNALFVSLARESIGLNLDEKVFGHLDFAQHLAHTDADFISALQRPAVAQSGLDNLVQMLFGCLQQFFSFARALKGQIRIATDNQSFPRIIRVADLCHVARI